MVALSSREVGAANALWHPQPAVNLIARALGAVDITRRGEVLSIANLGIGRARLIALLAPPPLAAELIVAIAGGA